MSVPLLDVQRGDFDDRNLLLQLALGLVSTGERLAGLLEQRAAAESAGPPPGRDDPLAHFVLGLLSVRANLRRHLEDAARQRDDEPPAQQGEDVAARPRVLR